MIGRKGTLDYTRYRFWRRVDLDGECWEWTGAKARGDYGLFGSNLLPTQRAHRVAWLLERGPIPAGLDVCHTCDNRLCVRPDHLFLGTRLDNMRDAVRKGRRLGPLAPATGERQPGHKLTWTDVDEIRRLHASGVSLRELTRRFPVSRPRITQIVRGIAWRDDFRALHVGSPK